MVSVFGSLVASNTASVPDVVEEIRTKECVTGIGLVSWHVSNVIRLSGVAESTCFVTTLACACVVYHTHF